MHRIDSEYACYSCSKLINRTGTLRQAHAARYIWCRLNAVLLFLLTISSGFLLFPGTILAGSQDSPHTGRNIRIDGVYEALYEDYEDGNHRLLHFLNSNGKRYELAFDETPANLKPGQQLRINGVLSEHMAGKGHFKSSGTLFVLSGDDNIQFLSSNGGSGGGGSATQTAALPGSTGEQRIAVILVNFQDNQQEPYTLQEATNLVFGATNDFYIENSSGRTWLSGAVFGWYTLPFNQPVDSSTCSATDVALGAQQATLNAGIDLSAYNHYIYVFPQTSCLPSGAGTIGGDPSEAWINGSWFQLKTVGHELGHNLGLFHSGALECGDSTVGNNCQVFVYGDTMDIMGNQSTGHFNAFQKERLGWLDTNLAEITTATSDGEYTLEAYEIANGSAPRAVKILKESDPTTGEKTWYYLEYRQAIGFDDFLAGNNNILNGVIVRMASDADPTSSVLLDTTPASSTNAYYDWQDPAINSGNIFSDPDSGITITTTWADESYAIVNIGRGQQGCIAQTPLISTSPAKQSSNAGSTVEYTISITNQDSAECAQATFTLDHAIPAGWTGVFSQKNLGLTPGETGSVTFSVTSEASATAGTYQVAVNVSDAGTIAHSGSASADYTVVESCTVVTPGLSLSPATQSGEAGVSLAYTISLTNNDSATCQASNFTLTITSLPGGWSGDLSPTTINLSPGAMRSATFTVTSSSSATAGSYNLQIAASDAYESAHAKATMATYVVNDTTTSDDIQQPTVPTGLVANAKTKQITLSWNASSDNVGVTGYRIWRDSVVIADVKDTGYNDRDIIENTLYEYRITAYDAANNTSTLSEPVTAIISKGTGGNSSTAGGNGKGKN